MKPKISSAIFATSALFTFQPTLAMDLDDLNYEKASRLILEEGILDAARLNNLSRRLGKNEPQEAQHDHACGATRCKPLKGLKLVTFEGGVQTYKNEGYKKLTDFDPVKFRQGLPASIMDECTDKFMATIKDLGIQVGNTSDQKNLPRLSYMLMLVEVAPSKSSMNIMLREKMTSTREPKQTYLMPTFECEVFGRDVKSGGKNPREIIDEALAKFASWYKLANK